MNSIRKLTGDIDMAEQVRVVVDAMGGDNAPVASEYILQT